LSKKKINYLQNLLGNADSSANSQLKHLGGQNLLKTFRRI